MTHVKLLSVIAGFILIILTLGGFFGLMVAKILGWVVIGGIVLMIYFFIHGITFGEHTGNGFD